jgi:hypothetical protein
LLPVVSVPLGIRLFETGWTGFVVLAAGKVRFVALTIGFVVSTTERIDFVVLLVEFICFVALTAERIGRSVCVPDSIEWLLLAVSVPLGIGLFETGWTAFHVLEAGKMRFDRLTVGFVVLATERISFVAERRIGAQSSMDAGFSFGIERIAFDVAGTLPPSKSTIDTIVYCMGFRIFDVFLMEMIATRATRRTTYCLMIFIWSNSLRFHLM